MCFLCVRLFSGHDGDSCALLTQSGWTGGDQRKLSFGLCIFLVTFLRSTSMAKKT